MSKFCKFCGKQLEEGEVCACTQNAQPQQPQVEADPQPAAEPVQFAGGSDKTGEIKAQLVDTWVMFKEFVKKPITVGKALINECDFKKSLFYIGVHAILIALLTISLLGKINSAVGTSVFPLFKSFIVSLIACFGYSCIIPLVLMLAIKIFKGNTNYQYMLCASSVNSIICVPFALLAIIISILTPLRFNMNANNVMSGVNSVFSTIIMSMSLPVAIAGLGSTLGYFTIAGTVQGGAEIDKEKVPYMMFVTNLVMLFVLYFVFKIVVPMCMPDFAGMMNGFGDIGSLLG